MPRPLPSKFATTRSIAARYTRRPDTEHVPVCDWFASGRVVHRNWHRRSPEKECELCHEPLALPYGAHCTRGDHWCMELMYNATTDYPLRVWNPDTAIAGLSHLHARLPAGRAAQLPRGPPGGPRSEPAAALFERLCAVFDRDDHARRREVFELIRFLHAHEVLLLDDRMHVLEDDTCPAGPFHSGALLMAHFTSEEIFRLFPDASSGAVTTILGFTLATWNWETVYDLCGLEALDERRRREQTLQWVPHAADGTDAADDDGEPKGELAQCVTSKARFCLGIVGQLRWALGENESTRPEAISDDAASDAMRVLCRALARALVAECLVCRTCEFVVRTDGIWRERGCERLAVPPLEATRAPPPCTRDTYTAEYGAVPRASYEPVEPRAAQPAAAATPPSASTQRRLVPVRV